MRSFSIISLLVMHEVRCFSSTHEQTLAHSTKISRIVFFHITYVINWLLLPLTQIITSVYNAYIGTHASQHWIQHLYFLLYNQVAIEQGRKTKQPKRKSANSSLVLVDRKLKKENHWRKLTGTDTPNSVPIRKATKQNKITTTTTKKFLENNAHVRNFNSIITSRWREKHLDSVTHKSKRYVEWERTFEAIATTENL